jgi:hypothetical protein
VTERQEVYTPDRAVAVAKERAKVRQDQKIVVLSTGYRARVTPVSPGLLNQVQMSVPMPRVPTFTNEAKGRTEENPNDPTYLQQLEEAEAERVMAALDAIVLFGVDLVDDEGNPFDYPADMRWLQKLRYLERRKLLSLEEYDLDDDLDLGFLFKKYVAIGTSDMKRIAEMSGLDTDEEVEKAIEESFQAD